MDQHIKIVAVLYIVLGILCIAAAMLVFVFGAGAIAFSHDQDPDSAIASGACITVIAVFIAVMGLPSILAGWGLLKRKQWARILTIILAILHLFNIPIGTAIGAYSLWVLFNPESQSLFT